MLSTWPPDQEHSHMAHIDDINYMDSLLQSSIIAREYLDITESMLKSYEVLATGGLMDQAGNVPGVGLAAPCVPGVSVAGFGLLPTVQDALRPGPILSTNIASGYCDSAVMAEETNKPRKRHRSPSKRPHPKKTASVTLMLRNMPRQWDFNDIINILSKHDIFKCLHYDCICIPQGQKSRAYYGFINATNDEAKCKILGVLNGLCETEDGEILLPPLELHVARDQGLPFYVEFHARDSMFFCGTGEEDSVVQSCSTHNASTHNADANEEDRLLERLLQGAAGENSELPSTSVVQQHCIEKVDQGALLSRLLQDAEGIDQVGQLEEDNEGRTTVCIKGLSKDTSTSSLVRILSSQLNIIGGRDIDFLYLPVDFARNTVKGYAIMNFTTTVLAKQMVECSTLSLRNGTQLFMMWAAGVQGLTANAKHFLSRHNHIRNPRCRPVVWLGVSPPETLVDKHLEHFPQLDV